MLERVAVFDGGVHAAFCGVMRWSASGSRTGALVIRASPSASKDRALPTVVAVTVSGGDLVLVIRGRG